MVETVDDIMRNMAPDMDEVSSDTITGTIDNIKRSVNTLFDQNLPSSYISSNLSIEAKIDTSSGDSDDSVREVGIIRRSRSDGREALGWMVFLRSGPASDEAATEIYKCTVDGAEDAVNARLLYSDGKDTDKGVGRDIVAYDSLAILEESLALLVAGKSQNPFS